MSRDNRTNNGHDKQGGSDDTSPTQRTLITHAIRASRTTRQDRAMMRETIRGLDRIAQHQHQPDDPATPPQRFVEQLRRPARGRRRSIVVLVDGKRIPVLINPQGRTDPDREQWLWDYICGLARNGATE